MNPKTTITAVTAATVVAVGGAAAAVTVAGTTADGNPPPVYVHTAPLAHASQATVYVDPDVYVHT